MTSGTRVLRPVIASELVARRAPIAGSVTLVLMLRILTNLRVSGLAAIGHVTVGGNSVGVDAIGEVANLRVVA